MASILEQSGYDPERKLKVVGTAPVKHDGEDKVTGRALFGADLMMPGMLVGKILRSPHPHAILKSINVSKAEALEGVHAVVTREDFPDHPQGSMLGDATRNSMAREKVFYEGHTVAAVAAVSEAVAKQALKLIKVDYEILPHVIDPLDAMKADAPILHEHLRTTGVEGGADRRTNVVKRVEFKKGDVQAGFKEANVIIEREFKTHPIHQGYIEPLACVAYFTDEGRAEVWSCTQGPHAYRDRLSAMLNIAPSKIRVIPSELGGGFGGKNGMFAEPVALVLARKAARPVKIVLTRNEVFRCSGPVAATHSRVKMGVTKSGRITAAEAEMVFQTGAFTGSMFENGPMAMFAPYNLRNAKAGAYEVVSNRPKVNPFRAPCVPPAAFGPESVIDELAKAIGMDPIELRLRNAATEGYTTIYGQTFGPIGMVQTLEAAKNTEHYRTPPGPDVGRGVAAGFWFNRGGETSGSLHIATDGSVELALGTVDVAGSRISMCMMVAEEMGIPLDQVRAHMAHTDEVGNNMPTVGSRTTFSSGMIVVDAARKAMQELCTRAAGIWGVSVDQVRYKEGRCYAASKDAGELKPLSIADITGRTGAISCESSMNVTGAGPGFGLHIVDLTVDKQTGITRVLRYTVVEDAGKAIHPVQVEGQYQGGAVQGIGWALNEEYIYGEDGRLQDPSFLDYRMPVASDVPNIETVIVEVPNPKHPYGLRGVGEVPVVPTLAAIANAVTSAIGSRPHVLPMSPPRLLKLIEGAGASGGGG